jgi:predicted  nucleic acid-binding Zn-ribbon protein
MENIKDEIITFLIPVRQYYLVVKEFGEESEESKKVFDEMSNGSKFLVGHTRRLYQEGKKFPFSIINIAEKKCSECQCDVEDGIINKLFIEKKVVFCENCFRLLIPNEYINNKIN